MRHAFVLSVLRQLTTSGHLDPVNSILAVCSGPAEYAVFTESRLSHVTLSGLDPSVTVDRVKPFSVCTADVRELPFEARSFDFVFVSDGLHHCDSPHSALVEMCRVARRGVIVFESRDSVVQRLAERIFWPRQTYELGAVEGNGGTCGGVNYTCVPNYVYRWTEREFEKTICCCDPTGAPTFKFFYGFNPPARNYSGFKRVIYSAAIFALSVFAKMFKRQSNSFCMVAFKPATVFPWLEKDAKGELVFKQ